MKSPYVDYSTLKCFDLIFYRAECDIDGVLLESRAADLIRCTSNGVYLEDCTLPSWDRVGLILTPRGFVPTSQYDDDSIEVIEAMEDCITTRVLGDVLAGASHACVRQVVLSGETPPWEVEKKTMFKKKQPEQTEEEKAAEEARQQEIEDRRESFVSTFDDFVGDIMDKPYSDHSVYAAPQLKNMFQHYSNFVKHQNDDKEQKKIVTELVEEVDDDNNGLDFEELLGLFAKLHEEASVLNTFSNVEVTEMVSYLTEHDANRIGRDAFVGQFMQSLNNQRQALKDLMPALSGAFVSQALQTIGVLEPGKYYGVEALAGILDEASGALLMSFLGPEIAVNMAKQVASAEAAYASVDQ